MFLVSDTWEERKAKILKFAEQDICVGVLLATINVEWVLRRCILAMGTTSAVELRKMQIAKLSANKNSYKANWASEVAPNVGITLPRLMETRLLSAKDWKPTKSLKTCNGWAVLDYAFKLRHVLVHGVQGSASPEFAQQTVALLLEAAEVLTDFATSQGATIFGKPIRRRKPFVAKIK